MRPRRKTAARSQELPLFHSRTVCSFVECRRYLAALRNLGCAMTLNACSRQNYWLYGLKQYNAHLDPRDGKEHAKGTTQRKIDGENARLASPKNILSIRELER